MLKNNFLNMANDSLRLVNGVFPFADVFSWPVRKSYEQSVFLGCLGRDSDVACHQVGGLFASLHAKVAV